MYATELVICERCQMKLAHRLTSHGVGPRGQGVKHWCAACRPWQGGEAERAEVVKMRREHFQTLTAAVDGFWRKA